MRRAYVPDTVLDEIRGHIVEIVAQYVTLKPAGTASKGLCPFHEERTPSFSVHGSRKTFKCFGCGASGDVFEFLKRMYHISFPEAISRAAAMLGIKALSSPVEFFDFERRRRIRAGAAIWRRNEIRKHAELLRDRDRLIGLAGQVHAYCSQSGIDEGLRDQVAFDLLGDAYIGDRPYSLLEYEFGQLLRADVSTAELHREIA